MLKVFCETRCLMLCVKRRTRERPVYIPTQSIGTRSNAWRLIDKGIGVHWEERDEDIETESFFTVQ